MSKSDPQEIADAIATFEIHDEDLPRAIKKGAFGSGGYPFDKKMDEDDYLDQLRLLQIELVKLQSHLLESGKRVVVVFEGRDAAGKGGAIKRYSAYLNPRHTRVAALPKPSDREQAQWYFQRYVAHMPTAGETVLFDRSWYNRAVVEPVMGFCTPAQTEKFIHEVPHFERMLVDDGIKLFKFWLNIGQAMQIKRFHDRRHDPLKHWKLSPVDIKALGKWNDYTQARNDMLVRTNVDHAPWTVVRANDKKRARLGIIRHVLDHMDYDGKELDEKTATDERIVMDSPRFMNTLAGQE